MTLRPVEAVAFWRYGETNFRATYGRLKKPPPSTANSKTYTKDYLQCAATGTRPALDWGLKRTGDRDVSVEYRWPNGGVRAGPSCVYRKAANDPRAQLAWPYSDAPDPWQIGDPTTDPVITIPGDPSHPYDTLADAEYTALEAADLDPWIMAVKLADEGRVLHCRAYLGKPPPGLAARAVSTLPAVIQEEMTKVVAPGAGGSIVPGVVRSRPLLQRLVDSLERDPNVLLIGPPGTGKTVALEDLRSLFDHGGHALWFDPDAWNSWDEWSPLPAASERKSRSLVFHPSYTYEDFVAGLVPRNAPGGGIELIAQPGPLVTLAHWAADPDRAALLVADEFNRGNTAGIFGDTLALLDAAKRSVPGYPGSGASIERPHPRMFMGVPAGLENAQGPAVADPLGLPSSVWIVAALNASDRSVAPLDAALRRRFAIVRLRPDYDVLATHLGVTVAGGTFSPALAAPSSWTEAEIAELAVRLLQALNERITLVLGEDFELGHALVWDVDLSTQQTAQESLAAAFDERISATLRLTFTDQDEALAAVLKAGPPPEAAAPPAPPNRIAAWKNVPADLRTVAAPTLDVKTTVGRSWADVGAALQALL